MPIGNLNTNTRNITIPVGTFADKLMQYGQRQEAKAMREEQLAKEDARYRDSLLYRNQVHDENLGFKTREENRLIDKIQLDRNKKLANNAAMKVILHPKQFSQEEKERVLSNPLIDQKTLFNTESALYKRNVNTPGTAEYAVAEAARRASKHYDREEAFDYNKKLANIRYNNSSKLQTDRIVARAAIKAQEEAKKQAKQDAIVQNYRNMMAVPTTKKVDQVINQEAIDGIEANQEKFSKTYSTFLDKARLSTVLNKQAKLQKQLDNTPTTNLTRRAGLIKQLKTVNTQVNQLYKSAMKAGNDAIGSIGLQEIPKSIHRTELVPKTKEEFSKDVLSLLPKTGVTVDQINAAKAVIDKHFPPVNKEASEMNRLTKRLGGVSINSNNPKVATKNLTQAMLLKRAKDKDTADRMKEYTKSLTSDKGIEAALKRGYDTVGTPDAFGSSQELYMRNMTKKLRRDNKIPENIMSEFIDKAFEEYNDNIGVSVPDYINSLKSQISTYLANNKKPPKKK